MTLMFSEPVKLIGEGRFNLNVMKSIKVTDSYLDMDNDMKDCQNGEDLDICTTRQHTEAFVAKCGCIPFRIGKYKCTVLLVR